MSRYDHTLALYPHCGMGPVEIECGTLEECRTAAARLIRRRRRQGFYVYKDEKRGRYEITEPEDAMMVPDSAGFLVLEEPDYDDDPYYEPEEDEDDE